MREIKFRAWDKKGQIGMIENLRLDVVLEDERYVIMQFTGLKDKNGKEIYEGDIVSHRGEFEEEEKIGVIEWFGGEDSAEFYVRQIKAKDEFGFYEMQGKNFCWDELEIIGNIYENPELLEREE